MSKSILSLFVVVILMVGFVAIKSSASPGQPATFGTFEVQMINFNSTGNCGEAKVQNNNKNLKVEITSCLSSNTTYRVCIYWEEGATGPFSASLGTPTTDDSGDFTFFRDLDDGSVPNLSTTDALEDLVVQVRSGSTSCADGTIEAASGVQI